jgi:hypothetical protein
MIIILSFALTESGVKKKDLIRPLENSNDSLSTESSQLQIQETKEPKEPKIQKSLNEPFSVNVNDFELLHVIGKGSFGEVFQVKKKSNGKIYAMKVFINFYFSNYDEYRF